MANGQVSEAVKKEKQLVVNIGAMVAVSIDEH